MSQSRRWCFTVNHWTEVDEKVFLDFDKKYLVYGKEIGESGTPHLQGFIVFNSNMRLSGVKKLHPKAHWESARGTSKQASDYCKKADPEFVEVGECPLEPKDAEIRRWDLARQAAKEGRMDDIPSDIYIRYDASLKRIRAESFEPPHRDVLVNYWVYGQSGSGKSRGVRKLYPDVYIKMMNKYWEFYKRQDVVLLEDFDRSNTDMFQLLKIWSDHYRFPCEVKHGALLIRPRIIFVTSQYRIEDLIHEPELQQAMLRRFKQVEVLKGKDLVL